jgi:hypothetical protein
MGDEARDPETPTTDSLGPQPEAAPAGDLTADGVGPRLTCRPETGRAYQRTGGRPSADRCDRRTHRDS